MTCNRFGTATKVTQLSEMSMPYLKADLETLGISMYDLNDLHEILPSLIGIIVEIEIHDDPIEDNYRVNFLIPIYPYTLRVGRSKVGFSTS